MNVAEDRKIICGKCNLALVLQKQEFTYQRQVLSADLLKCPQCGQVYIPEKLVKGKMFEVEKALEDK